MGVSRDSLGMDKVDLRGVMTDGHDQIILGSCLCIGRALW